jgi:type I restriction-modification system DNA methylase subunit
MTLFQRSVIGEHLRTLDTHAAMQAYESYQHDFLPKIANIRTSKEEQYQYGFLDDLFVKVLGYTLNPSPEYNLIAEQKNTTNARKADGAILREGEVIAVIELKSTTTRSMERIVDQAFGYKHNHPACTYVITSNFEKLRLYVEHSDRYEEFNLFDLDRDRFTLLHALLGRESIMADVPLSLKRRSKLQEENISNELYRKYAGLRANLFENIIQNNPAIDKAILLEKTQTILDRMVFVFFAEDRGILPTNTIDSINEHYKNDIEDRTLWHFFKIYFRAIEQGNAKLNIPAYNGGLFAADTVLDNLIIDDAVIEACPLALSAYDFNSEVDVNILGHIFENSLNDIEELKARIHDADFDPTRSKRKKDGVFYTPEYITRYIVDNTLGTLCHAKKAELGLDEVEIEIPKNPKKLTKTQTAQKEALEAYRAYLLELKILDPACGSGAFLNQALGYLLDEHAFIDEGIRTLMGGAVLGLYDVKKGILENNLYGVDINAEAVEIAKLSLWLRTVEPGRKLNRLADKIKVGNSLIDDPAVSTDAFVWEEAFPEVFAQGGFDVVIGNPPYGAEIDKSSIDYFRQKYATAQYKMDTYSLFTEKVVHLTKQGSFFGLIIPYTWLSIQQHRKLRKMLLEINIDTIVNLPTKVFEDADLDTTILIAEKSNESHEIKIGEIKHNAIFIEKTIGVERIKEEDNHTINLNLSDDDFGILERIRSNSVPLEKNFEVSQGYVPYRRSDLVKRFGKEKGNDIVDNRLWHSQEKLSDEYKQEIQGRDISRYAYNESYQYVKYGKHLAGYVDPRFFQNPRIVIMEVTRGDKYKLKATYLEKELYNTPSIINIISKENDKNDLKALLVIVNSRLLTWYHVKVHPKANAATSIPKILVNDVRRLPVAILSKEAIIELLKMSDLMMSINIEMQTKKQTFLHRLRDNLDLDKPSKKLEAFWQLDFKDFLKELKKKKITLGLSEQDKWEAYFDDYKSQLTALQHQIDTTDREIDAMVYALYGLRDEEIAVVEGKE